MVTHLRDVVSFSQFGSIMLEMCKHPDVPLFLVVETNLERMQKASVCVTYGKIDLLHGTKTLLRLLLPLNDQV